MCLRTDETELFVRVLRPSVQPVVEPPAKPTQPPEYSLGGRVIELVLP